MKTVYFDQSNDPDNQLSDTTTEEEDERISDYLYNECEHSHIDLVKITIDKGIYTAYYYDEDEDEDSGMISEEI